VSFPPEHLIFWANTGCADQDDPVKDLVLYNPAPALLQQAYPALPTRRSFGLQSFTSHLDYTEGLNLRSLQTSSYNCRNKYFGRMTALPFSSTDAVIPWHVDE